MYIFSTYFVKQNLQSPFVHKYLKPLANKTCHVCEGEKFQIKERNTVIIFQRDIMAATCDAFDYR